MLSLGFLYISNDSFHLPFLAFGDPAEISLGLTFILTFTINVFHCFLKIHSQNDSILLEVDLFLS